MNFGLYSPSSLVSIASVEYTVEIEVEVNLAHRHTIVYCLNSM